MYVSINRDEDFYSGAPLTLVIDSIAASTLLQTKETCYIISLLRLDFKSTF